MAKGRDSPVKGPVAKSSGKVLPATELLPKDNWSSDKLKKKVKERFNEFIKTLIKNFMDFDINSNPPKKFKEDLGMFQFFDIKRINLTNF